jgi:hypothetical protein
MKLIFLDIDGVLNKNDSQLLDVCVIEEKQLLLLSDLIRRSGAEVILTSSWRLTTDEPWREPLLRGGVSVAGQTARLNGNNRRQEIELYLKEHSGAESFVILDDQAGRWGKLKNNCVHINPKVGLTEENVAQTLKILEI